MKTIEAHKEKTANKLQAYQYRNELVHGSYGKQSLSKPLNEQSNGRIQTHEQRAGLIRCAKTDEKGETAEQQV